MHHPWWRTKQSWSLFSPTFLVQACLRAPQVLADKVKLTILLTYFLFFLVSSFSFYAFCFSPTSGILRKLIFLILIYGQRSVAETWTNPSPWSIFVFFHLKTSLINWLILVGPDVINVQTFVVFASIAVSLFFSLPILLFTHFLSTGVYRAESSIILRRIRPAKVYNLLEFLLMDLP